MQHEEYQRARDEAELTNAELARLLGVSESLVCKIMRGHRNVSEHIRKSGFYRFLKLPEPVNEQKTA